MVVALITVSAKLGREYYEYCISIVCIHNVGERIGLCNCLVFTTEIIHLIILFVWQTDGLSVSMNINFFTVCCLCKEVWCCCLAIVIPC